MTTKQTAQHILSLAKAEGAEFCEVVVTQNEFSLKRIRQGQVDQPPAGEQWEIDMAMVKDGRKKSISFDNPAFAKELIQEAMATMDMLGKQDIYIPKEVFAAVPQPEGSYDKKTAQLQDQYLLDIAHKISAELEEHNLFVSGKIAQSKGEIAYANSTGTTQAVQFTLAVAALFAFDKENQNISAYASSGGSSIDHIETKRITQELIEKCELQRGKEKIDLFANKEEGEELKIDVIVQPSFFGPILEWLGAFGFNGLLVERGESFLSDKMGKLVMGKNISLVDNPAHSENRGVAIPFDFEGRPRKKLQLIDNGIAKNAVYDTELANTWKKQPTGNALPPSYRSQGAAPFDMALEGGNSEIEEMITSCTEPTLWITKVHYLAVKHYQTATMTGVAQHGVFLIEHGKVVGPVENMRFEQSIVEALTNVQAMGKPKLYFDPRSLSFPTGVVLPVIKIKDFRFVGSTKRTV